MTSAAGPSVNVHLPEDTRMRIAVRRRAAFALVGMTLHTVLYVAFTILRSFVELDPHNVLVVLMSVMGVVDVVSAPLLVLGAWGLRAYPRNGDGLGVALLISVSTAAALRVLRSELFGLQLGAVGVAVEAAAALLLLLSADRILRDGAGDPTAPASRIARTAMIVVVVRRVATRFIAREAPELVPLLGLLALFAVTLEMMSFTRVRKLLL